MSDESSMLYRGPGRPRKEAPPETVAPAAEPARSPVTESPEFIEALARVKAEMHAEFEPLIAAFRQSRGEAAVEGDNMSFARQMAMAIAEIADQDVNKPKRVPPEEMAKRARARSQMDEAIAVARRKAEDYKTTTGQKRDPGPDAPLYLATGKSCLDDRLVEPFEVDLATKKPYPVTFIWMGAPNEAMRPVNEAAKEIFGFFTESIGGKTEIVAAQAQSWISAGGLVIQGIHGTPVNRVAPNPEELAGDLYQRGPGQFDPRRSELNILGTIAEPARHVSMGGSEPRKGI